jgi:hypothetical protein
MIACVSLYGIWRAWPAPWAQCKAFFANGNSRWSVVRNIPAMVIFIYGVLVFITTLPIAARYCRENFLSHPGQASLAQFMPQTTEYIKSHALSPETIILSHSMEILHIKTGTFSALPFSSLSEIILTSHLRIVQDIVNRPETRQIFLVPADYSMRLTFSGYEAHDVLLDGAKVRELRRREAP